MKRFAGLAVSVLAVLAGASAPVLAEPAVPAPSVYAANPWVSVGALRLDVTADAAAQIPEGWRHADALRLSARPDPYRLVKFSGPVGSRQRELLDAAGYTIVAYHPFNSFLVRPVPGEPAADLAALEGVSWTGPFHPYFKILDVLGEALEAGDIGRFVVAEADWGLRFAVRLHEDGARSRVEAVLAAAPGAIRVFPTRTLPIRVQVSPDDFAKFLQYAAAQPEVAVIEPWLPAEVTNDENVQTGQAGSCVAGNEGPRTPVFNNGVTGWNARIVVADTCTDSNEGWWYDDALGRLTAHEPSAPWTSTEPDWSQRKLLEYYDMYSADTTLGCGGGGGNSNHGTHVSGTTSGNCSLNAEGIATQTDAANSDNDDDGMAPGAYLIVEDLGGDLQHLNVDGGVLGDLFELAWANTCQGADCGIDAHNNSWGSAANIYGTDASTGDEALWKTQRGLIVASAGNEGSSYGSLGTPATGKNIIAVANASGCSVDFIAGGSSRGPAGDGRLKPDVAAGGSGVTSAANDGNGATNANGGCSKFTFSGTSMASPTITGLSALVLQYFNDGFYPTGVATPFDTLEPSGPLMKAMLINTAQRMTNAATAERNGVRWPNHDQGWGFVALDNALYFPGDSRNLWVWDEVSGVDAGATSSMTFQRKVTDSAEPLKITLVWYDTGHSGGCGTTPCLDNDLDLTVFESVSSITWKQTLVDGAPGQVVPRTVVPGTPAGVGQTTTDNGPDNLNTVEQVIIYNPTPDAVYEITVSAANTPSGPIPFALVATGATDDACPAPTGAAPSAAADTDTCSNGGVLVSWNQDVGNWNDGGTGTRFYRVWRDGMPIRSGPCAGRLPYGTTSCLDSAGPDNFSADYRVEYVSGCGATTKTPEVAATDEVDFFVEVSPDAASGCPGDTIVLEAAVDVPGSYTYQWTEDGVDLVGENSSTLSIAQGTPQVHEYNCIATEPGSCFGLDAAPSPGTWLDEPPSVGFYPPSAPQLTLEQMCGDGDGSVEPGEIWRFAVGLSNASLCNGASNVTADLAIAGLSTSSGEVCNATAEFGDIAAQANTSQTFAFRVDEAATCPGTLIFDVANIDWDEGGPNDNPLAFAVAVAGDCSVTSACSSCDAIVVGEVSPVGAAQPLIVTKNGSLVNLEFQRVTGAPNYNLYVSTSASTLPMQVVDPSLGKTICHIGYTSQIGGTATSSGVNLESGITSPDGVYYFLLSADNGPPTEGTLGFASSPATERQADSRCAD